MYTYIHKPTCTYTGTTSVPVLVPAAGSQPQDQSPASRARHPDEVFRNPDTLKVSVYAICYGILHWYMLTSIYIYIYKLYKL